MPVLTCALPQESQHGILKINEINVRLKTHDLVVSRVNWDSFNIYYPFWSKKVIVLNKKHPSTEKIK